MRTWCVVCLTFGRCPAPQPRPTPPHPRTQDKCAPHWCAAHCRKPTSVCSSACLTCLRGQPPTRQCQPTVTLVDQPLPRPRYLESAISPADHRIRHQPAVPAPSCRAAASLPIVHRLVSGQSLKRLCDFGPLQMPTWRPPDLQLARRKPRAAITLMTRVLCPAWPAWGFRNDVWVFSPAFWREKQKQNRSVCSGCSVTAKQIREKLQQ